MSLKTSTDMILPEPSEELITSEAWSMETYADGLMDELFSDLDNALKNGKNLSSRTAQREYSQTANKTANIRVEQIVVPETLQIVKPPQVLSNNLKTSPVNKSHTKPSKKKVREKTHFAWGKLLNGAASFAAIVLGVVWLANSGLLNRLSSSAFQQALREPLIQKQSSQKAPVDPQAELVNYMLAAFTAINSEQIQSKELSAQNLSAVSRTSPNLPSNISSTRGDDLPPVANANSALPPSPGRYTRVIERVKRVYVKVPTYKAPEPMRYQPPSIASTPQKLTPPTKSNSQPSKSQQVKLATKAVRNAAFAAIRTGIKPVNIAKTPISIKQPSKPISALLPAIPSAPTAPSSKQSAVEEQKQKLTVAKASVNHELKGVMDLGEQSAAIFKIEGADLQIRRGETIGTSGWTLVDITGKEAIIRRNGEVRSIQAGQSL
ncbi:MAG: hypothetical protein AAF208_03040 [Cyanobacteria bacterium P01_A01_bin.45]